MLLFPSSHSPLLQTHQWILLLFLFTLWGKGSYARQPQTHTDEWQKVSQTDSSWPAPLHQLGLADPGGNDQREETERVRGQVRRERVREKAADLCLRDSCIFALDRWSTQSWVQTFIMQFRHADPTRGAEDRQHPQCWLLSSLTKVIIFATSYYTFASCAANGPEPLPLQTGEKAEKALLIMLL